MNRSLLLVICDFIILSLLALANFDDVGSDEQELAEQRVEVENVKAEEDLIEALKLSLEAERASRDELSDDLDLTQQALLDREETLAEREARLETLASDLETRAEEQRRLEEERAELQERVNLTEAERERLARERTQQEEEARRAREIALRMERELQERLAELEKSQQTLAQLEGRQREAEEANRRLSTELELSDREKLLIRQNLEHVRAEVNIVREEKTRLQEQSMKLAQGVSSLAQSSEELTQEVRRGQPKTPATIFSDFQANKIRADFRAFRARVLGGDIDRSRETRSILVTDGEKTYALVHIESAGLSLRENEDWQRMAGRLSHSGEEWRIRELSFLSLDPRIAVVEVPRETVEAFGTEVYQIAREPFRFPETVLISSSGKNYGESSFTLNADHPRYVQMPRRILGRLFGGEFAPSRGDLVFSKTGELIGMMVNNEYCALIDNFLPGATLQFNDLGGSGRTLLRMNERVINLPQRLRL